MKLRKLILAALTACLFFPFATAMSGCCNCNDEEASKELEKKLNDEFELDKKDDKKDDKKGDKGDKADKGDEGDDKADDKGDDKAEDKGGDSSAAVKKMTPDKLEAKVKDLGWSVVGEPTKLNDGSITLPIVKGTIGGAVSLNDFSSQGGSIATNSFVDTMKKNDGCALSVDGDKVLSVLMPGNKAEADKLMEELTK